MRTILWINLSTGRFGPAQGYTPDWEKISQDNFRICMWDIYRGKTEYEKLISKEQGRLVEGLW